MIVPPIRRFAARQFTVRLGDIDLSTDREPSAPVTFKVTEVRAHPRFSRVGFYNDIALLVLDRPVRKSKYVIPVCLPKPNVLPATTSLAGRNSHLNRSIPTLTYPILCNLFF